MPGTEPVARFLCVSYRKGNKNYVNDAELTQ